MNFIDTQIVPTELERCEVKCSSSNLKQVKAQLVVATEEHDRIFLEKQTILQSRAKQANKAKLAAERLCTELQRVKSLLDEKTTLR